VALRRGLPASLVERVVAALARPPRAAALHAVADLVAHRFDADSAAGLIIEAVHDGVPQERLLDVSTAVLQQVQRGHTRAEALAIVRRDLPNLARGLEADARHRGRRAPAGVARTAVGDVAKCHRASVTAARPARVSTVKRARVAREIPPGGIET